MATKIMYLMDDYRGPQAGTEGQLLQLLRHLDRSRYVPAMTFLRGAEYALRNPFPCPVRVLGITKLASVGALAGMLRFAFALRREGYRLVHCFFNDASLIAPLFLRLAGLRVAVSRRDMGIWYTPGILRVLRLVAPFVDRYVANSRAVARHVQLHERVPGHKLRVIYNGYAADAKSGHAGPPPPEVAGIGDGAPVVGIVANLRPVKRIDVLVEAFAAVAARFANARLVIVGDCSSAQAADTRRALAALAGRLGLQKRIVYAGQVDEPMRYVAQFTAAVLCSQSEGFSNSLIEYLLAGRPVVCTDAGGNPEIVQDGINGFLVPVGDADALADRLIRLLSDAALARRLGDAGRRVAGSFTHERMVSEQMACYDEMLPGGRRGAQG